MSARIGPARVAALIVGAAFVAFGIVALATGEVDESLPWIAAASLAAGGIAGLVSLARSASSVN